jgi:N-acetylglutamate synthase-like GNAT family acetyltransferase
VKIPLSSFETLSEQLSEEDKILHSRTASDRLYQLYKKRLAAVITAKKKKTIVGFAGLWPTQNPEWLEFGTLWIHPELRNNHFSGVIFDRCLARLPKRSHVFLITKSRKVIHLAKERDWIESEENWTESLFWQTICVPWDHVSQEQGSRILPKEGRLFYLPYTKKHLSETF